MDPVTVIAIFMLGASAGCLITHIRYRSDLVDLREQLQRGQQKTSESQEAA